MKPKPVIDYATASGLDLTPEQAEFVNQIMAEDPREVLFELEREEEKLANIQFEEIRLELLSQDAERKRLWGNKYPRKLGQKPGEVGKRGPGRPRIRKAV